MPASRRLQCSNKIRFHPDLRHIFGDAYHAVPANSRHLAGIESGLERGCDLERIRENPGKNLALRHIVRRRRMTRLNAEAVFSKLKAALQTEIHRNRLRGHAVTVRYRGLTPFQAIGSPSHRDYPILRGKENMVEAEFCGSRGQAFTDELSEGSCAVEDMLNMRLDSNAERARFVAGLNAVYRHLGIVGKTVHCRDHEPITCAAALGTRYHSQEKVLLVGLQPRFLETLAGSCRVRVLDLDPDNIGTVKFGVEIEPSDHFDETVRWCDRILATGSTLVNATLGDLLNAGKPVDFYGVTIAAAAEVLQLQTFCHCGH